MEKKIFYPFYQNKINDITYILHKEFHTEIRTGQFFWDSIGKCLYDVLYSASVRVLIAEMHACKDMGKLWGETEEGEYDSYCCLLEEESYRDSIYKKYAGLSVYLKKLEQNQLAFWREVLYRLKEDWKRIGEAILGIREEADWQLETVKWTGSDFHDKGKAVIALETNQGIRFFYKPHSLHNEIFLQSLLREICDEIGLGYPMLPILTGMDYGWVREAPCQECGDMEGVAGFYRRIGALAAVSYVLGIGDLHYENLIAWGEYPIIIDAETMFQNMGSLYEWSADRRDFYSALSSGLFPGCGVDKGMAAVTGGQGTAQGKVPVILYEGSSRMQIGYRVPEVRRGKNRVRYRGEEMDYCGYGEEIAEGFHEAYGWFLCHVKELSGKISEAADILDSRYVSGNTQFFAMAVSASAHPDLLEKPGGREEYLKKICRGRKLAKWEVAAMADGDVPLFRRRIQDRNLYSGGEAAEAGFFDREIEGIVRERFRQLCMEDCVLQERVLLISVEYFQKKAVKPAAAGWMEYAKGIAQQIRNRMICHKEKIFWLTAEGERTVRLKPMGIYLYSGLAGMAVFFRAFYQECGLHGDICDRLEQELLAYTDRVGRQEILAASEYPGMYCGEGSVAYAYQLLYQMTGQERYREYAERHGRILIRFTHQKEHFDLLYGNAGAVLVLCRQYEMSGDPVWLEEAGCAMEQLEAGRIWKGAGVSWYGETEGNPVCGIAHGNSGILLAYAKLYSLAPTAGCLQRMKEIVAYENQFVDEGSGNWADMKKEGERRYETYAWCNGGVGAVHARVLASMWNPGEMWLREEAERGAVLLERLPVSEKMCLCHGNMGNWLVLRTTADYLKQRGLREKEKEFRGLMERCMDLDSMTSEVGGDGFINGNAGVGMGAIVIHKVIEFCI